MYVYLSVLPIPTLSDGATPNYEGAIWKNRGAVGPGDDADGFARAMARRGHHVFTHPTDLGARVRCRSRHFAPELLVKA